MKYILSTLAIAATVLATSCAQNPGKGFSVKGDIDVDLDSVYFYDHTELPLASAPVVNKKFEIKGKVEEPTNIIITGSKGNDRFNLGGIILDNDNYTYSCKNWVATIKGGKLHETVRGFENSNEYKKASKDANDYFESLFANNDTTTDDISQAQEDKLNELEKRVYDMEDKFLLPLIESADAPPMTKAFALLRSGNYKAYNLEKRIELLKQYKEQLGKPSKFLDFMIDTFQSELEKKKMGASVAAGSMFKDVEAKDMNGNTVKLSEVIAKNKFTILEFWASWCGPCRGEIPNLKKAYEKYKSKGFEIYAISLDEKNEAWLKALEEEKAPWINVSDGKAYKGNAVKDYGVSGIPASFLIDQKGIIRASDNGLRGKELDETLGKLMP